MKKKVLFIFLVLSLIALPLFGACAQPAPTTTTPATTPATPTPAPAPEVIKWKMQSMFPSGTFLYNHVAKWAEGVKVASGGRLDIAFYSPGEIVAVPEMFDAVSIGTLNAAYSGATQWMGKFPASPFFSNVPCDMKAEEYVGWMRNGGGVELYRQMYDPFNVYVIPITVITQECLGWFKKPILTLEDYKGLKFRTIGFWAEILQRMGASVISVPGGEVYEALQRGVIDAAEYSTPATDKALGLHEICPYVMFPGIHQISSITELIVNKDSWQELPADLKAIAQMGANENLLFTLVDSPWEDQAALEFFKQYGTKIVVLSPEVQSEIKRIWEQLAEEKAAKDPFIAKIWESRKQFRAKWEAYDEFNRLTFK